MAAGMQGNMHLVQAGIEAVFSHRNSDITEALHFYFF